MAKYKKIMVRVLVSSVVLGALMALTIIMSKNHTYIAIVTGILYIAGLIRVMITMSKEK